MLSLHFFPDGLTGEPIILGDSYNGTALIFEAEAGIMFHLETDDVDEYKGFSIMIEGTDTNENGKWK